MSSPDNFFYWLQGYFELTATSEPLTDEQGACVSQHIDLVKATFGPKSPMPERIVEIRALLTMLPADPAGVTSAVRQRIHDQFVHVIDPKAGGPKVQAELNSLHSSGSDLFDEAMRC